MPGPVSAGPTLAGLRLIACVLALAGAGTTVSAQDQTTAPVPGPLVQSSVLVLDQDRLFGESRFGKAVLARHQQAIEALQTENRRIESALEAEERDLTERRSKLPAKEFQTLAADFDSKAEGIRKAQTAKSDDIKARLDAEQPGRQHRTGQRHQVEDFLEDAACLLGIGVGAQQEAREHQEGQHRKDGHRGGDRRRAQ